MIHQVVSESVVNKLCNWTVEIRRGQRNYVLGSTILFHQQWNISPAQKPFHRYKTLLCI